ncbi:MAG: DUF1499 domain-containing protein [Hyphomonadaceae bacterium]|nr:DUF1499 domain-containing protein [Hyphomonadaceae bacterium]
MGKFRDFIVRAALTLSLLVPVYFAVAALGTKFGLLDWRIGFGLMTFRFGIFVFAGAAAFALLALLVALVAPPRRGVFAALLALAIPGAGMGYGAYVRQQAQAIPPIHDISTDLIDPPAFSQAVVAARAAVPGGNDLDLLNKRTGDGRAFVDLQREAYGDIQPVSTAQSPRAAFDAALALAETQGWTIARADAAAGVIEATATTFWYGFTDDIVIRVRPEGEGARVDARSVSRVGRSDLGANAARLRPYLAELRARLA